MTFIATPIIADNLLRIDTRCNCAIFYFPRGEIAIGVRVLCVTTPPSTRGRGGEIRQRKKGGSGATRRKGVRASKGDGWWWRRKRSIEGERFYVYSPWRIPIAGGVQEEKAGGEVAKRVKSSGARNR